MGLDPGVIIELSFHFFVFVDAKKKIACLERTNARSHEMQGIVSSITLRCI